MNTFYMMIGLPGSGKSSWIAENLRGVLAVSSDAIIEQQAALHGTTYDAIFPDCIDGACRTCADNLASAIAEGRDVVLDQTNLTVEARVGKLLEVPPTYRKIAVVVMCGSAIKLEKRRYRPGKIIREEVSVAMRNCFVFPTKAEGFDEIRIVFACLRGDNGR